MTTAPVVRRRRRFGSRSLTVRLVGGVVALVMFLVLATGAATYVALNSYLTNRLDQQLIGTVGQNFGDLVKGNGISIHGPQDVWMMLLDADGASILTYNPEQPTQPWVLSPAQREELASNHGEIISVTTTGGDKLRVVSAPPYVSYQGIVVIPVVGLSTGDIDHTMHRLIGIEVMIGATALVFAFFVASAGVGFSLRRLRRVTATAHEVAAELSPEGAGLERRVPVPDKEADTEVGQLAESVNTLLAAVETQFAARLESEQLMRQFLADASHELRTPLTSIRGYAELARMQREQAGIDAESGNLDRIESEGIRMSRLIDDLLLLARSDKAVDNDLAEVRVPIWIDPMLEDVASGVRAAFPERKIELAAQTGLSVLGDPDQLIRAIRNLVTNAAVHTDPNGPIAIRARIAGAGVLIEVIDSGPGLPQHEVAHVFERFWRADKARTRARGGSGLGMSIVASIVAAHGGSVRFDSTVTGGSTAAIWLPVEVR